MTRHEAFRFGFLARCCDEGLTPEQITARVKQASLLKQALPDAYTDTKTILGDISGALWRLGVLGLLGGGLAGAGTGYALANATTPAVDPEATKQQELVAAYKQQADRLRRLGMQRRYRDLAAAPRPARLVE